MSSVSDGPRVVWEDSGRIFSRESHTEDDGSRRTVLVVRPATDASAPELLERFAHEYALRDVLDPAAVVRPLRLVQERGQPCLVLEDCGHEPLECAARPLSLPDFLRIAIGIAVALAKLHASGLIHKDIKPAHILVDPDNCEVKLTGLGFAALLPRQRPLAEPPGFIAGTLAFLAPEQTGRMNRPVDARSDLYSLGVTLYLLSTGTLPFVAADATEWIHRHIARNPVPPSERVRHVPEPVSRIVMKLLAKTPEDRYQTAWGVERDLRRCLNQWETQGRIDDFLPGQRDMPDRLVIPDTLYGRSREIDTLVAAFERVARGDAPALVLVTGQSGIGKSAVVHQLHKALVPPRGLFAAGKFDRDKRDIPYSTLTQALEKLVRPLLSQREAELGTWRDAMLNALGPNASLMTGLVPDLALIIGEPPPVPDLPPRQAQDRFQMVFERFIGVFARPDHPLVLFLDDLQWLDAATLDVLEHLLLHAKLRHLLLVGAYRDNEVDTDHPLARKLDAMRRAGATLDEIRLAALERDQIERLLADTVRCEPEYAAPLAQLLHTKTGGNPFFVSQFLYALSDEKLLCFDHRVARWSWDIQQIWATGYTDNVVDLMTGKLARLPVQTRHALQQLACVGTRCSVSMLPAVLDAADNEIHRLLWPAVCRELIELRAGVYRFTHDRIQETAYSLIPDAMRARTHLQIGRRLAAQTPAAQQADQIFDIVGQFNRGAALIDSPAEREQLAALNLVAGQRARASSAYASALAYLSAGAALMTNACRQRQHTLAFSLELLRAECEFLTGATAHAQARLDGLTTQAATTVERAAVARLGIDLHHALGDQDERAITVGLDYLRGLGAGWSRHPSDDEAQREYDGVLSAIGVRTNDELVALPLMRDPDALATLDVLIRLGPPTFQSRGSINLFVLIACRAIALSLASGHGDASCYAYALLGIAAGVRFGDYQAAARFGRLGCDLVERHGLTRFEVGTRVLCANNLMPWTQHVTAGRDLARRGAEVADRNDDVLYGAHAHHLLITNLLAAGDPLADVLSEAERGLAQVRNTQYGLVVDMIATQRQLVRTLLGLTPTFGSFDDGDFDERALERQWSMRSGWATPACFYWIRKMQARFFCGDHQGAVDASLHAQRLLWGLPLSFELAEYHLYAALSRAGACDSVGAGARSTHLRALSEHHGHLAKWSEYCPQNFECRVSLVGAEIARVEGHGHDAERLYDLAIRSAREHGFVHVEALACEQAARFQAARGLDTFALVFLRHARDGYLRWGADGKVRQLEQAYPQLRRSESVAVAPRTIETAVEHLDLATVTGISQAVSGEFELAKLLDKLMRMAVEHAGAERCVLTLARDGAQHIAALATTVDDAVDVRLCDEPATAAMLPETVLQYVLRTRESVILDDAFIEQPFAADPYVAGHRVRSVLCLPLINRTKLIGALYLENNLAARVFVPGRIAILKVLASQAAITLENARLYHVLADREARIRRLVDANIVGILIWDVDGHILETNDAFLRIVGYDRDDLVSGRVRWPALAPSDSRETDAQRTQELTMTGALQPYEKELSRKDGRRASVLIGVAALESNCNERVGFVLDLSERKHAEAQARENERRYLEAHVELAHANRAATMGQLTASIAHDVQQPITAVLTEAAAALNWLNAKPPNLDEIRESLDGIVSAGMRAGAIVERIRALIKKAPLRKDCVDINDTIREMIDLTQGEAAKSGVSVTATLAGDLPPVRGDRVQLQQVMLNLIVNAIEAMSTSTRDHARELVISTARLWTDRVLVTVRDSGPGIAAVEIERVFDAFYTTKAHGLGMGLSICRSIVEAHGGVLSASAGTPHGAVFTFVLPSVEP
ncbi:hypothetical protein HR51_28630 [Burkholderia cepacia]|nr:hypothetical protein HR51_28630 [Burkholderia cepacia]